MRSAALRPSTCLEEFADSRQHLNVLEDCGLVKSRKAGRARTYHLTPQPLKLAEGWPEKQRSVWARRFDQLDTCVIGWSEQGPVSVRMTAHRHIAQSISPHKL
jgi:hypothetical protein